MKTSSVFRRLRGLLAGRFLLPAGLCLALSTPFLAVVLAEDDAGQKKEEPKEAQAGEKKDEKKPPRNPLTDLIKRSLGKSQTPAEAAGVKLPNAGEAPNAKKSNRNASDQRAPYDKRADDWMRKAVAHIKADEWKAALELLQKISELPEDTLYRTEGTIPRAVRGPGPTIAVRGAAFR